VVVVVLVVIIIMISRVAEFSKTDAQVDFVKIFNV
jgi:hypothetical protein